MGRTLPVDRVRELLARAVRADGRGPDHAHAGDNAAVESFWSLLQTNVLNQRRWATRQELRLAIVVWIERKYHRQRPQDSLGGLTPVECENKITAIKAPAA